MRPIFEAAPIPAPKQSIRFAGLDNLAAAIGAGKMAELVEQSVSAMRASFAELVEMPDSAELAEAARLAHDLKATSGGFGAIRLQRLAASLDLACKEGREADARRLLRQIPSVAEEAYDALEAKYVSRPNENEVSAAAS